MKRILTAATISLFFCWTASALQGGAGEVNQKRSSQSRRRPSASTASKAPIATDGNLDAQQLRRVQAQEYEAGSYRLGRRVLSSTAKAFKRYLAEQHNGEDLDVVGVYKLPLSSDHFLAVTVKGDVSQNVFFAFAEHGGLIEERVRLSGDVGVGNWSTNINFFTGTDRVLISVSISAVDGYMLTDYMFEWKSSQLVPMGKINVYKAPFQRPYSTEPFHSPFNPGYGMASVVGEFKNGTYYLTILGNLYVTCPEGGVRRIENANSRTVFGYDGKAFRPTQSTRASRPCEAGML